MDRRTFNQTVLGSSIMVPSISHLTKKYPPYLQPGDKVGLICPAGLINEERLTKAKTNIESLGLVPVLGKNIMQTHGYLAGKDQHRLEDLHDMYRDDSIRAIWCIRGGFGCTHLLPYLDLELIRSHPKMLLGYSDITAFHNGLYTKLNLHSLHSPVAASDFTQYTVDQLRKVIFGVSGQHIEIGACTDDEHQFVEGKSTFERYVIYPGQSEGLLIGGNLSLLVSLCGTPYFKIKKDSILYLEDIEEAPYRIDRMLTHLFQAIPVDRIKGIVCGVFEGCERKEHTPSLSLKEVILERLSRLQVPAIYGFSFGHISNQCTIPIGAKGTLNTASFSLSLKLP